MCGQLKSQWRSEAGTSCPDRRWDFRRSGSRAALWARGIHAREACESGQTIWCVCQLGRPDSLSLAGGACVCVSRHRLSGVRRPPAQSPLAAVPTSPRPVVPGVYRQVVPHLYTCLNSAGISVAQSCHMARRGIAGLSERIGAARGLSRPASPTDIRAPRCRLAGAPSVSGQGGRRPPGPPTGPPRPSAAARGKRADRAAPAPWRPAPGRCRARRRCRGRP
ncbi:hypothetical protein PSM7751_00553 [Pseudooceanicola marinus]|uniref:Uncharacterized protein n=1 Tax=Pseudooceanicola marinus TaxID=396013 RepID=A0A1X6YCQ9_9RHOB|nr:hypothetical protein PSM7751_00553 [Pseudooceanicola marinus]